MDKDNFFTNTKPNLISDKVIKRLEKILEKKSDTPSTNTLVHIYQNYIQPYWFFIIVVVLTTLFLFIKYCIKKYKDENEDFDLESQQDLNTNDTIDEDENKEHTVTSQNETEDVEYEENYNSSNFETLEREYSFAST